MSDELSRPIFLLGTGRCGSTYVQSLICRNTEIWVWGEHDGCLGPLYAWTQTIRDSNALRNFTFPYQNLTPEARLTGNANVTAWMQSFLLSDIDQIERDFLHRLFAERVPEGKKRWGFKEIRYGPNNRVPEHLLRTFPDARIIHLVRDPISTADSSVRAWKKPLVSALEVEPSAWAELDAAFMEYLRRWKLVTNYFMNLEATDPIRVRTFRLEDIRASPAELLQFIGEKNTTSTTTFYENGKRNEANLSDAVTGPYGLWLEKARQVGELVVAETASRLKYC